MSRWHRNNPEAVDLGWEEPDPLELADMARDARKERPQEEPQEEDEE